MKSKLTFSIRSAALSLLVLLVSNGSGAERSIPFSEDSPEVSVVEGLIGGESDTGFDFLVDGGTPGGVQMEFFEGEQLVYVALLDGERLEVTSYENGQTYSERWLRPAGDLLEYLDMNPTSFSSLNRTGPFAQMQNHDLASMALEELFASEDSQLHVVANRFQTAFQVYSNWWTASVPIATGSEPGSVSTTDETDVVVKEPKNCDYFDKKKATTLSRKVDIAGVATLTVEANHVTVSAFCETRKGCLKAKGDVTLKGQTNEKDDGTNGCPQNGTEPGDEEFRIAKISFEGNASVKEGCAKNYDDQDVAAAFTATLSAKGLVDAKLTTTEATPDGVGGESLINGTAIVCFEDDLFHDDPQDLMFTGTASSTLW